VSSCSETFTKNTIITNTDENGKIQNNIKDKDKCTRPIIIDSFKLLCTCPIHNSSLIRKSVKIEYRKLPLYKDLHESKDFNLSYCDKCKAFYISMKEIEYIKKKHSIYSIETRDFEEFRIYRINNNPKIRKLPQDEVDESKRNLLNLRQESYFYRLGYSVQLPREARWRTIIEKILPWGGCEALINHIRNQINLKDSIISKNYSYAIAEWKYDLERILELAK